VLQQNGIDYEEACAYADTVIERFKNPYLDHKWLSISFAYTSKMVMRNIPLIKGARETEAMALGFAAYLLFMRTTRNGEVYEGNVNGNLYRVNDDKAAILHDLWKENNEAGIVSAVLSDKNLWGSDLTGLADFAEQTNRWLSLLLKEGARIAIAKIPATTIK